MRISNIEKLHEQYHVSSLFHDGGTGVRITIADQQPMTEQMQEHTLYWGNDGS